MKDKKQVIKIALLVGIVTLLILILYSIGGDKELHVVQYLDKGEMRTEIVTTVQLKLMVYEFDLLNTPYWISVE